MHNIFIHPVLVGELDDTIWMLLREKAEEGVFKSCFPSGSASDQRCELEVIADEDKRVRESQRAETGGKGDLRGFVDDAVVELASGE